MLKDVCIKDIEEREREITLRQIYKSESSNHGHSRKPY